MYLIPKNIKTKREILKSLLNIKNYSNISEKNFANDLNYFDNHLHLI